MWRRSKTLAVLDDLVEATAALTRGETATATAKAISAEGSAERWGLLALRAEALCLVADALLCAARDKELMEAGERLEHLASLMESRRFRREARFYTTAAMGRIDPAFLELMAADLWVSPVLARRARAILGGKSELDMVDLRVLESLTGSGRAPHVAQASRRQEPNVGERDPWRAGWGLDEATGHVWLEDGTTIKLGDRGLPWRILVALVDNGGSATNEHLVTEAWMESDYHPMRHDGKVRVAVRKLREFLGDTDSEPTRIATEASGYSLLGEVRRAS
jgi:hypothetical protein